MKYTVSINEAKRSITVTLADGTKGTARCCPTDHFNINTGIELALERAKVAKAMANKEKEKDSRKNPSLSVMELVKALENALPVGEMVIVGNGKELTDNQKAWLRSLAGGCDCKCHEVDEDEIYARAYTEGCDKGYKEGYEEGYENGYDEGYYDGRDEAEAECDDYEEYYDAMQRIIAIIDDIETID